MAFLSGPKKISAKGGELSIAIIRKMPLIGSKLLLVLKLEIEIHFQLTKLQKKIGNVVFVWFHVFSSNNIWPKGVWPTGNWPTGNWPTGNWTTGNRPTGDWPTGVWLTGIWLVFGRQTMGKQAFGRQAIVRQAIGPRNVCLAQLQCINQRDSS
jgi:hypothetical protein